MKPAGVKFHGRVNPHISLTTVAKLLPGGKPSFPWKPSVLYGNPDEVSENAYSRDHSVSDKKGAQGPLVSHERMGQKVIRMPRRNSRGLCQLLVVLKFGLQLAEAVREEQGVEGEMAG